MKTLTKGAIVFAALMLLAGGLACRKTATPTSTFKTFYEAQKNKDLEGMKKTLSKSSMAMLEKGAKQQNKTVDEALKTGFDDPATKSAKMPETRNEKIEGDSATLEVQDDQSKNWEKMFFVKEDGEWKIALDKTIEELIKKSGQQ